MLQYALLHLFDYAVSLDDLKNFRVSAATGVRMIS
jgi:transketolase